MARAKNIGNVYAELSVKDKMSQGLNKAEKSLTAFGKKIAGIGAGFAVALPAAAFAGLAVSMKSAIDAGGALSDMMARTGAEGEGLFVMQRAFENAGIAADKVPGVLNKMQKALAGVNEEGERVQTRVFSDLGLSIESLRDMDAGAAFRKISESIAQVEDPAKRAALAMEIFGRSGAELLVVMTDAAAFDTAAQQVGGLGKTLADNAAALDKVSDAMQLFQTKAMQIGAEVAVELLPALESFADWANEVDLGGVTRDLLDMAGAMAKLAEKTTEYVKQSAIGQKLGLFARAAEFGISTLASLNPEEGTALPVQYLGQGGFASDPMSNYNDGVMLADVVDAIHAIPDALKPKPQVVAGMSWENAGIPGLAGMLDALATSVAPMDEDEERSATRFADFAATQYDVNEMQRRGLGMGAENVARDTQKQIDVLQDIRDTLKRAELQESALIWN